MNKQTNCMKKRSITEPFLTRFRGKINIVTSRSGLLGILRKNIQRAKTISNECQTQINSQEDQKYTHKNPMSCHSEPNQNKENRKSIQNACFRVTILKKGQTEKRQNKEVKQRENKISSFELPLIYQNKQKITNQKQKAKVAEKQRGNLYLKKLIQNRKQSSIFKRKDIAIERYVGVVKHLR